jgi:hypothetical protein
MPKFEYLRAKIDSNDQFVAGSQTQSSARTSNGKRVRETPEWVYDQKFVTGILLRAFPKLGTDKTQLKRAARWREIIQVWWRVGEPETRAVNAINENLRLEGRDRITPKKLHDTVRRIRRIAEKGLTTSGKFRNRPRNRPMGRPRKKPMDDGPDEWGNWEP